ncbi:CRE-PCP-1 protein [Aphelenchoides bicaudatus]|nr:CRE-PCP-1 protein [Aphelenchoides bicaudatus]
MRAFLFVLLFAGLCDALRRLPKPSQFAAPSHTYETKTFSSKIDNFDPTPNKLFNVKYLVNNQSFVNGQGPLFFYTGNEGTVEGFAANTGIMFDLAPEFNALIVFCEHRYYGSGSSQPFGKDSFASAENARFLTIEQTFGDYITLIQNVLPQTYNFTKVIAFGGSYGGMLSAWFREKYPTVVDGAWAASAPVAYFRKSKTPMGGFSNVVGRTMKHLGCDLDAVTDGFSKIDTLTNDQLNTIFNVNSSYPIKNSDDVFALKGYIREGFEYMAMTCYPYPSVFLRPLDGWPMLAACNSLQTKQDKAEDAVKALKKAIDAFYDPKTPACFLSTDCQDAATAGLGDLHGWEWQSCTQIAIDICAQGGDNDPFWQDCAAVGTDKVKSFEDYFKEGCGVLANDVPGYKTDWVNFDFIKNAYGFDLKGATNLILTQGYLDPWSAGGADISSDDAAKREIYMYTIEDAAHHLDLRTPNSCDPPSVVAARYSIVNVLKKWLGQTYDSDAVTLTGLGEIKRKANHSK